MKYGLILPVIAIFTWVTPTRGESSVSPDGRFKISSPVQKESRQGLQCIELEIRDTASGKSRGFIKNAAYCKGRQELNQVLFWHPKHDLFAVIILNGRWQTQLKLFSLVKGRLKELSLPDYLMNALGRVHALDIYNTCLVRDGVWSGDSFVFDLEFNVRDKPEEFGLYTAKVRLTVSNPSNHPAVFLEKISITKEFRPGE